MTTVAILTLLHVLVLVYWLGGDLGAYYASRFVYDGKRPVAARALAAKVLGDIDMAPRICLLLALPTGLALAASKGWVSLHWLFLVVAFLAAGVWILIAFAIHMDHGGGAGLKRFDVVLRWAFLLGLAGTGAAALLGEVALPRFLALKLLLLAFAVLMGLLIRRVLTPFGPAFGRLMAEGPSPATDAALRAPIARARPFVLSIWAALILAAYLGIATPT